MYLQVEQTIVQLCTVTQLTEDHKIQLLKNIRYEIFDMYDYILLV